MEHSTVKSVSPQPSRDADWRAGGRTLHPAARPCYHHTWCRSWRVSLHCHNDHTACIVSVNKRMYIEHKHDTKLPTGCPHSLLRERARWTRRSDLPSHHVELFRTSALVLRSTPRREEQQRSSDDPQRQQQPPPLQLDPCASIHLVARDGFGAIHVAQRAGRRQWRRDKTDMEPLDKSDAADWRMVDSFVGDGSAGCGCDDDERRRVDQLTLDSVGRWCSVCDDKRVDGLRASTDL